MMATDETQNRQSPILDNVLVRALRSLIRRRGADGKPGSKVSLACGATKYGCDPRTVDDHPPNDDATEVTSFALIVPGIVGELVGGITHLDALLQDAGDDRVVVLKFKREGCAACKSTIAPLASAAESYAGRVDFVTVDYDRNRAFCKQCALAVVPCAHVYVAGQLADAMPLGPRAWAKFAKRLEEIAGEPDGEVLAAEIPPDKNARDARSVAGLDGFL